LKIIVSRAGKAAIFGAKGANRVAYKFSFGCHL
jgi:hypothetical protein